MLPLVDIHMDNCDFPLSSLYSVLLASLVCNMTFEICVLRILIKA